jgi:hypothetical protein
MPGTNTIVPTAEGPTSRRSRLHCHKFAHETARPDTGNKSGTGLRRVGQRWASLADKTLQIFSGAGRLIDDGGPEKG